MKVEKLPGVTLNPLFEFALFLLYNEQDSTLYNFQICKLHISDVGHLNMKSV